MFVGVCDSLIYLQEVILLANVLNNGKFIYSLKCQGHKLVRKQNSTEERMNRSLFARCDRLIFLEYDGNKNALSI